MSEGTTLPDWAVEHMNRYLETDGEDGHIWRGSYLAANHDRAKQRCTKNAAADIRQRR